MLNENVLVMMVGLSRSGKSTFCKENLLHYPIVNQDSIRLALHGKKFDLTYEKEVLHITKVMIKSLFFAGHKIVILDRMNPTIKSRNKWKSELWKRYFIEINTSKEECLRRAEENEEFELIKVINQISNFYQSVQDEEYDIKLNLSDLINNSL